MEAMLVFTKRLNNKSLQKLEKQITRLIQDFNANPLTETTTEMSFLVDMKEPDLEKLGKKLEKVAQENEFEFEIVKQ